MAIDSSSLSSSLHKDLTEHVSNQSSCSSSGQQQQQQRSRDELVDNNEQMNTHEEQLAETVSMGSSKESIAVDHDDEDDDDDSDDEDTSDYLLDTLLSRNIKSSLSIDGGPVLGGPGLCGLGELDRTYSNRSLRSTSSNKCEDLDRTHSNRSLPSTSSNKCEDLNRTHSSRSLSMAETFTDDDKTWTSLSSLHSSTIVDDDKNWTHMDSVHSSTMSGNITPEYGNSSTDFNDSCCSFASFGGSDSDMNDSATDLSTQRAAFTSLVEQPTPRRIMLKTHSVRTMSRNTSFRGTGLSLIEESSSLD